MQPVALDFEQIYAYYYQIVFQQAYQVIGHLADAEDITQEVFLLMLDMHPSFSHIGFLPFWLSRAVHVLTNAYLLHDERCLSLEGMAEKERGHTSLEKANEVFIDSFTTYPLHSL